MRKVVAFLISTLMVITMPMTVLASEFSDMPNDWSTVALKSAVAEGLFIGTNGQIRPKDNLTRAQMAAVINRAFASTQKASLEGYTDVAKSAWYYDDMAMAVHMKTFVGSGNMLNPDRYITREEAFVVLARAFQLSGGLANVLDKFTDKHEISSWAKEDLAAMVSAGYISGSNGKLNPKQNITRAQFAQMMHNLLQNYLKTPGIYTEVLDGNVMISAPDVILKNVTVKGDLILGDGVGDGDVTLDGVKVTGRIVVRGGGINSIKIIGNSEVGTLIISKVDGNVRVMTADGTIVEAIYIDDGKDDIILEGEIGNIEIAVSDVNVMIQNAKVQNITVTAPNTNINIDKDTTVDSVNVSQTAQSTALSVSGTVTTVNANATGTTIGGEGTVVNANIQGNNSRINTIGTNIEVGTNVIGTTSNGESIEGGTTGITTSNGGVTTPFVGGGGGSTTVAVSAISVTTDPVDVIGLDNNATVIITLATSTDGATIYYTLDGTTPGSSSIVYTVPFDVTTDNTEGETITVKAIGIKGGMTNSAVAEKGIVFNAEVVETDLTDYNAALAAVEEADYTVASWDAYQLIVADNIVTVADTQEQVNSATGNIITAQGDLVFAGQVDLDAAKAAAALLTPADYVDYSGVTVALAMPETTNAEVVAKTTAINEALDDLVEVADLTVYNAALAAVEEADYTVASWDAYQLVVVANVVTVANSQEEVDAATAAITTAQADLVTVVDANLQAAKDAEAELTAADYVDYSAVTTALAMPEGDDAEKIAKTTAIYDAIAALVEVVEADLTGYNAALAAVEEADYTVASWDAYQLIVADNTVTVVDTQEQVNSATGNIITAQGDLVFAGQADLDAAKAAAALLIPADYVDYSAVTAALVLPETTNSEVVAKTMAINEAIDSLEQIILVSTVEDLNNIRNNLSGHYIQVADIDLENISWTPIGDSISAFSGSYNGDGFKISNLTVGASSNVGLFGQVSGTIKNVVMKNVTATGTTAVGGLVGTLSNGNVKNSNVEGSITGRYAIGALVGYNYNGIIEECSVGGTVHGIVEGYKESIGGLVGRNMGTIVKSFSAVEVYSEGYCTGGLVGNNGGGEIIKSFATGNVTSTNAWVGGLVGDNRKFNGQESYITESYATGNVTGSSSGGLIGLNEDGTVQKSYYDLETTLQNDSGKGIPKTTEQMKQQATFINWDFTDTWAISEGVTYPRFQWENP